MAQRSRASLLLLYLGMFTVSLGGLMYSTLVPVFTESFSLTLRQAGLIGSAISVGQVAVLLVGGALSRLLGQARLICVGLAAFALALLLIGLAPTYPLLVVGYFLQGACSSLLNVVFSACISDWFPRHRHVYMNILHGIYGIGALAGPLLPMLLLRRGLPGASAYLWVAGAGGVLALLAVRAGGAAPQGGDAAEKPRGTFFLALVRHGPLLLVCLSALAFMGFDMALCTWLTTYLGAAYGFAPESAGFFVTLYWLGSAAGRLVYPVLFARLDVRRFLTASNLLAVAVLLGGLLPGIPLLTGAAIALTGAIVGVNFPLQITLGCGLVPGDSVGVTSLVSLFGALGGAVMPLLAGWLMERAGAGGWITLLAVLPACVAGLMALLPGQKITKPGGKTDV